MCEWGNTKQVLIFLPARFSRATQDRWAWKPVDACIAPIVQALNNAGLGTVASCCGHGTRPGNIALADGRELIIAPDYDTARRVDGAFPGISGAALRNG